MNGNVGTSRRTFLQRIGSASACGTLQGSALWPKVGREGLTYGYIGSLGPAGRDHIEVFRVDGKRWTQVQRVRCRAPAALLLHPNRQFLYAANAVALHEGLPQGTVEVFSIDRQSGTLSLVQRRALSLSGTEPRSLAITPDGRYAVVAVYGGGAYNVLPIQRNGNLGEVGRIFKELGCGIHVAHQAAAHPRMVMFDRTGRFVLTSDFGCDRLSVFALNDHGELQRRSKVPVASGAGPASMVLHPGGSLLYVMHELKPTISCHRYRQTDGIIEDSFQSVTLASREAEVLVRGGLTIDSKGRFLYAASAMGITALAIEPASGSLSIKRQSENANALHISQDDRTLHAIDQERGSVSRMSINAASGTWDDVTQVASVASPVSLALLSC